MQCELDTRAQGLTLPCGARLKNRICKAAMSEGLAGPDNIANARHTNLYKRWGQSGAAGLITGHVPVDRWHLERGGNIAIDGAQSSEGLAALARPFYTGINNGAQLLSGENTQIRNWSDQIRIGRGLNAWDELGWYYEQKHRIADKLEPDQSLSGFKALLAFDKPEGQDAGALEDLRTNND